MREIFHFGMPILNQIRLNKIVSAYTDDKIFSLDLVGAVSPCFEGVFRTVLSLTLGFTSRFIHRQDAQIRMV